MIVVIGGGAAVYIMVAIMVGVGAVVVITQTVIIVGMWMRMWMFVGGRRMTLASDTYRIWLIG